MAAPFEPDTTTTSGNNHDPPKKKRKYTKRQKSLAPTEPISNPTPEPDLIAGEDLSSSTKRKRPSYLSAFPPLDEFNGNTQNSEGEVERDRSTVSKKPKETSSSPLLPAIVAPMLKPVTAAVVAAGHARLNKQKRAQAQQAGEAQKGRSKGWRNSRSTSRKPVPGSKNVAPNPPLRISDIRTLDDSFVFPKDPGENLNEEGFPKRDKEGRSSRPLDSIHNKENQSSSSAATATVPVPAARLLLASSETEGISRSGRVRCNSCIIARRKCDGEKPTCRLCQKSGKACIYEKEGITRSYLERMQRQAEQLRMATMEMDQGQQASSQEGGLAAGMGATHDSRREQRARVIQTTVRDLATAEAIRSRRWTYADHTTLLGALDRGEAPPNDHLFDEVTKMFAEYKRTDGSLLDACETNQYAGLRLNWGNFRYIEGETMHVPHGDGSGSGMLSSLRSRMGLSVAKKS